ncbi:regulation of response to stimulus [Branchiostoma belcheri]|nr:regulation of response to stimulus [Branchiostoma belcheri]
MYHNDTQETPETYTSDARGPENSTGDISIPRDAILGQLQRNPMYRSHSQGTQQADRNNDTRRPDNNTGDISIPRDAILGQLQRNPMYRSHSQGTQQADRNSDARRPDNNTGDISIPRDAILRQLQMNPMYRSHSQKTPQTEGARDSCRTDLDENTAHESFSNTYNQIDEEDVYVPERHDYCEISDDDDSEESDDVFEPDDGVRDETTGTAPGQASPTENSHPEDDEESLTFYAAALTEVRLPTTRNVRANTSLYNIDTTSEASSRPVENQQVANTVDQVRDNF